MYDDVTVSLAPSSAVAFAYYVNGRYANYNAAKTHMPNAKFLGISVTASYTGSDAHALDVEPGDATNAQAVTWTKAKIAQKVIPVLYTSAANAQALINLLDSNGVKRDQYWLWTAHYSGVQHMCSNKAGGCGYPVADATQWTDKSGGKSLDESYVSDAMAANVLDIGAAPAADKPGIPTDGGTKDITATTATATYTGVTGGVKYFIQVTEGGTVTGKVVFQVTVGGSSGSGVPLTGLQAGTKYGWRIMAYNADGAQSDWSGFIPFTTAQDANSWTYPAPAGLGIGQGTATVPVSWKAVAHSGTDAPDYTLLILDNTGKTFQTFGSVKGTTQSVTVPRGTYTARVWGNSSPAGSPHTDLKFTV